jgi:hypothetical protein
MLQTDPILAHCGSEHHAKLSMDRLSRYKRAEPKKMKLTTIKRTFWGPLVWLVTILYVATVLASYGIYYFGLWLKSLTNADGTQTWSTEMVNTIPIGGSAINVVFVWIWGSASDTFGRAPVILVQAVGFFGLHYSFAQPAYAHRVHFDRQRRSSALFQPRS